MTDAIVQPSASSASGPTRRPSGAEPLQVGAAATAPVVAALCAVLGAPRPLVTATVVVAAIATLTLVVRRRPGSALDATVVTTGLVLVVLVLVGLAIDVLPAGLSRADWVVGTAVVEFGVVVVGARRGAGVAPRSAPPVPTLDADRRRVRPRGWGWYVAGVVVAGVAIAVSVGAQDRASRAGAALSVERAGSAAGSVVVTSDRPEGPYLLTETVGGVAVTVRRGIMVGAGHPVVIALPPLQAGTARVELLRADVYPSPEVAQLILTVP